MTKQLLKFLHGFVDTLNPKHELNFAYVDFDNRKIVATNTRMLISINIPFDMMENCSGTFFLHKKVLKAMESISEKEGDYEFKDNCLELDHVKISVDSVQNDYSDSWKFPDYEKILNGTKYEESFVTEDISQLDFELSKCDAFINSSYINKIQELVDIPNFEIFYNKQNGKDKVGQVKIVANDSTSILFEVVYMGEYFVPSKSNQSIMKF